MLLLLLPIIVSIFFVRRHQTSTLGVLLLLRIFVSV